MTSVFVSTKRILNDVLIVQKFGAAWENCRLELIEFHGVQLYLGNAHIFWFRPPENQTLRTPDTRWWGGPEQVFFPAVMARRRT